MARTPHLHPDARVVTYEGSAYQVWSGGVVLNWRDKKVLFHLQGCQLCCKNHDHNGNCANCGPRYSGPRPDRCRVCGKTAHFTHDGGPIHKACLEQAILAAAKSDTPRGTM
jgi:hypothetical protein